MGAGGAFYVQAFQYIDPGIAYGAHTSVEALVGAIVGGMGTLWGPLIGALPGSAVTARPTAPVAGRISDARVAPSSGSMIAP